MGMREILLEEVVAFKAVFGKSMVLSKRSR